MRDKVFIIAKSSKHHWCQRGLTSMVYTFFDKKLANKSANGAINGKIISNIHLLKPTIRKVKKV